MGRQFRYAACLRHDALYVARDARRETDPNKGRRSSPGYRAAQRGTSCANFHPLLKFFAALSYKKAPNRLPVALPAPANVVRRGQADAEFALATRRRIYIRRAVANADRKTNINKRRKPYQRTVFNLDLRLSMREVRTEQNALTDHNIIRSFFGLR